MLRKAVALCAVLFLALGVFGGTRHAFADDRGPEVIAPGAPPVAPYESVPPAPGAAYVWVPGYWQYAYHRWVWVPGQWAVAPYAGATWVPGRWVARRYGWVWIPGHWQTYGALPPQPYPPAYTPPAVVAVAPPPPRPEVIVAAPFPGAVWVGGYWRWRAHSWFWVPGSWVRAPWRGAVWVPGHWAQAPRGWIWTAGYWR